MAPERLEGDYRLVFAPYFQVRPRFEKRLARCDTVGTVGGAVRPLGPWRPFEEPEFGLAVSVEAVPALKTADLGLFEMPKNLREEWWALAVSRRRTSASDRFQTVFSKLTEFLRFKRLPVPERVHMDVIASAPGLSSTGLSWGGATPGLDLRKSPLPLAYLNLGDETAFVVFSNLSLTSLVRGLSQAGSPRTADLRGRALVRGFFEAFPGQPIFRAALEPGEGIWLSLWGSSMTGGRRKNETLTSCFRSLRKRRWRRMTAARPQKSPSTVASSPNPCSSEPTVLVRPSFSRPFLPLFLVCLAFGSGRALGQSTYLPHFVNALNALRTAHTELAQAERNKGGYRTDAQHLVTQAINEVEASIAGGGN